MSDILLDKNKIKVKKNKELKKENDENNLETDDDEEQRRKMMKYVKIWTKAIGKYDPYSYLVTSKNIYYFFIKSNFLS